MEDEIAKYRLVPRPKPPSQTPSHASPSSNASSTNLPSPGSTNGSGMNERRDISSSLLLERLKEKKAQTLRVKEPRRNSGSTMDDKSHLGSSPRGSSVGSKMEERRPNTASAAPEKVGNMGSKEMEEVLSKLHKQNFDLKLEVFHRRDKQTALEERIAELEKENERLHIRLETERERQLTNERLVSDLLLKDQALEEAVAIICEREATIELMEEEKSVVLAYDMEYSKAPCSSPPRLDDEPEKKSRPKLLSLQAKTIKHQPSFLTDQSRSTEALRALFGPSQTNVPELPKLPEDPESSGSEDDDRSHSPQLSVLSESSFLSVYGGDQSVLQVDQDAGSPHNSRLPKSSPKSLLPKRGREKFLSLDHVASSPIRRIDGVKNRIEHTLRNTRDMNVSASSSDDSDTSKKSSERFTSKKPYTSNFIQDRLPPTPDTMSTNTLRLQQQSNDTLSKGIESEDDQIGATGRRLAVMQPQLQLSFDETLDMLQKNHPTSSNGRPRTAGETSRQGWELDSQAGRTESVTSDPWLASARESSNQKRKAGVQPPRLFDFASTDDWVHGNTSQSVVRDILFNNDHHVSRPNSDRHVQTRHARRSSTASMPSKSDQTVQKKVEKADMKDSRLLSSPWQRPPVSLRSDRRPPQSNSSTSNTPNSNIAVGSNTPRSNSTTPTASPSQPIKRNNSFTKRSLLPSFLGGINRSETLPNTYMLAAQDQSPSPPKKSTIDTSKLSFQKLPKKRNNSISSNVTASHSDTRNASLNIPRYVEHPGLSATPPAIKDNRGDGYYYFSGASSASRQVSGPATSSNPRYNRRPSTAGSLDSKLPMPRSYGMPFSSGFGSGSGGVSSKKQRNFSVGYEDGARDRSEGPGKGALALDGACDDDEILDTVEGGVDEVAEKGDETESRMGKLKGVVWKKLGRKT